MSTVRMRRLIAGFAVSLACLVPVAARAAISCSITSVSSITTSFANSLGSASITTGAYTISCTRASVADGSSFAYQLGANDGLNPTGTTNRGASGGQRLSYELYLTSALATAWEDTAAGNRFGGAVTFVGSSLNASTTGTFYLNIPTGSNPAAGTYTDTVTVTLRDSLNNSLGTTTFGVSILNRAACEITAAPGNVNFTYTSFQGTAAAASTTYATRCTNGHAYTMALDATSGTLLGLNYTLALSSASATGNGNSQTFTINGSIAAGQSGTCATASCTGTQTRTLTITY